MANIINNAMIKYLLVRAKYMRCLWALQAKPVSTINGLFLSLTFSFFPNPVTFLPEGGEKRGTSIPHGWWNSIFLNQTCAGFDGGWAEWDTCTVTGYIYNPFYGLIFLRYAFQPEHNSTNIKCQGQDSPSMLWAGNLIYKAMVIDFKNTLRNFLDWN